MPARSHRRTSCRSRRDPRPRPPGCPHWRSSSGSRRRYPLPTRRPTSSGTRSRYCGARRCRGRRPPAGAGAPGRGGTSPPRPGSAPGRARSRSPPRHRRGARCGSGRRRDPTSVPRIRRSELDSSSSTVPPGSWAPRACREYGRTDRRFGRRAISVTWSSPARGWPRRPPLRSARGWPAAPGWPGGRRPSPPGLRACSGLGRFDLVTGTEAEGPHQGFDPGPDRRVADAELPLHVAQVAAAAQEALEDDAPGRG